MELDEAFRFLGNFGRYQGFLYTLLCFYFGLSPFIILGMIFIGSTPTSFYCTPPQGFSANETVPGYGGPDVDACHMFDVNDGIVTGNISNCKYGWNYETSIGETTFVMDFDLVCDRAILGKVAKSVLMTGILVGSVSSGQISDYIGRKVVLHISLLAVALSGVATALVQDYYAFVVFYFLLGVFQQGVLNSAFVMMSEMFAPEIRTYAISATSLVWGFAVSNVVLVAYVFPNWRHYQLFISLIHLVGLPLWCIVPESTRWLISQGRIKEAENNLHRIAKVNGVTPPQCFLTEDTILLQAKGEHTVAEAEENMPSGYRMISNQVKSTENGDDNNTSDVRHLRRYNFTDIIKSGILLRSFLILAFCWFTNSVIYYGLSINSALLGGNKYVNVALGFLVEFPSAIIMILVLKWVGRRPALSSAFIFGSVCCVVVAFIPDKTEAGTNLTALIVAISTIGKFWASFSFSMIYLVSPEVTPTVIRQVTLGGCSFCSRVGGILAPFIIYLGDFNKYLPLNIIGACAFTAGIICLVLPETRNQVLPETIEEGEEFCRRIHIFSKCRQAYRNNAEFYQCMPRRTAEL